MKNSKFLFLTMLIVVMGTLSISSFANEKSSKKAVKKIHLDQYGGYFESKETLAGLKPGEYEFIVTNKTNKIVGFQIQNFKTHAQLDKFPLEPNETRISKVTITSDGFRYRCPINPTPWYDLDGVQGE